MSRRSTARGSSPGPLAPSLAPSLALGAGLLLAACAREPRGPYRHVVLISLDTVRADHLGCYGRRDARTPSLDALAARGVLFEAAATAAPTTLASHVSILTGVPPHAHGVARNGFTVHADNEMLPELLAREGYTTAAFLGSFALDRRFGFDQGFAHFDDEFPLAVDGARYDQDQRRAEEVTDAALAWIDRAEPEHAFLFVHYFDAHAPYDPPPGFAPAGVEPGIPARIEAAVRAQQVRAGGAALGQQAVIRDGLTRELVCGADGEALAADRELAALYAGEIAYLDREVGRLVEGLRARGMLEDALVVVLADHGETFHEHGDFWNHGLAVYETTAHVPLIVVGKGLAAGGRVSEPVSTIDVAPSVLELVGLPRPARAQGVSFVPALRGEVFERLRTVDCEATQPPAVETGERWPNARKAKSVRMGSFKYVRTPYLGLEELYDLAADPGERRNLLAGCGPAPVDTGVEDFPNLVTALRSAMDGLEHAADPLPSRFDRSQLEETIERLRGLGYVEGAEGGEGSPRGR